MAGDHKNFVRIAQENYDGATELIVRGRGNAAANRLYYAVFQLLYMDQLNKKNLKMSDSGKHDFIRRIAEEEYGREISEVFQDLKRLREDADYKGIFIGKERFDCMKSRVDLRYKEIKKKVSA